MKNTIKSVAVVITLALAITTGTVVAGDDDPPDPRKNPQEPHTEVLEQNTINNHNKATSTVEGLIRTMSVEYGIDTEMALGIARCESNLNPNATNANSTAGGVYQFIDGTWNNNCEGNKFNATDNITCFMEQFPKHPLWWECYKIIMGYYN